MRCGVALPTAHFCNNLTRYARAVSFVSDPSENDEVASMLNQIAVAARTPVTLMKLLLRAEFDANASSKDTILRTNSLASKGFGLYGRVVCKNYVCSHVLPLVRAALPSMHFCNTLTRSETSLQAPTPWKSTPTFSAGSPTCLRCPRISARLSFATPSRAIHCILRVAFPASSAGSPPPPPLPICRHPSFHFSNSSDVCPLKSTCNCHTC